LLQPNHAPQPKIPNPLKSYSTEEVFPLDIQKDIYSQWKVRTQNQFSIAEEDFHISATRTSVLAQKDEVVNRSNSYPPELIFGNSEAVRAIHL
jgi:hypothetical protein